MHVPAVPKKDIAGDQREQDGHRAYSCTEPGQYISPWRAGPGPAEPIRKKTVSCAVYSRFFDSNPGDESDLLHEEASGAGTLPGAPVKFHMVLLSRDFLPGVLHREGMTLCSGKAGIA